MGGKEDPVLRAGSIVIWFLGDLLCRASEEIIPESLSYWPSMFM